MIHIEYLSKSAFAARIGKSPSYVTWLKNHNRLVLAPDGKQVDVVATEALIRETADPSKAGVAARHEENRVDRDVRSQLMPACDAPAVQPAIQQPGKGLDFQKARAHREFYLAQLAEAEFNKVQGNLVERKSVEDAAFTAGSASNLAELAARFIYGDEIDRWDVDVDEEGDPVDLAETRGSTFGRNAKFYFSSSPTIKGASRISDLFEMSDHPCGVSLGILATGIDSGGHHTHEVYQFTRVRRWRNVFALKGASKPGRPVIAQRPSQVDVTWKGQTERNGAELWIVGTDTAKDWIYNRYSFEKGPRPAG